MVSSVVLRKLFKEQSLGLGRNSITSLAIASFYFDFRDKKRQFVESALRCIRLQLSAQSRYPYEALWKQYAHSKGQVLPTYDKLLIILDALLLDLGHTYIVLDALDECHECDLLRLMELISTLRKRTKSPLHLLVTSHRREDFTKAFADLTPISLDIGTTQDDIELFVATELKLQPNLRQWAHHATDITPKIVQKSKGMFRLAACLLFELSRRKLEWDPNKILDTLPSDIFGVYDRFLAGISPEEFIYVERVLRWLVYSARPVTLTELDAALAFDFSDPQRVTCQPVNPGYALRICNGLEGLVTYQVVQSSYGQVDGRFAVVSLTHASVQDYVLSPRFREKTNCDLSEDGSHTFIVQTCIAYLKHCAKYLNTQTHLDYPLWMYAARCWSYHLVRSHELGLRSSFPAVMDVEFSGQHRGTRWHFYQVDELVWPLSICSSAGYYNGVSFILRSGADVHAVGGYYGSALQAASYGGYIKIVQLLLAKGAEVNTGGGYYGSALQAASYGGHIDIVQGLLAKGAEVNQSGGYYGSALQAASHSGYTETVRLLLATGAKVDTGGGYYGSALQAAAYGGHMEIAQALLAKGAEVNTAGGYYGSALQAASYAGHSEIVQLLLVKGADVNQSGGYYGNSLQAAVRQGHATTVSHLLENGADVNARGRYSNALHAALVNYDQRIMSLLRQKDARLHNLEIFW
ncbi:ankyrin repeat-containing domain protein [Mycena epipterygia]|nr:ankyrin repeat-containing domain protein [Mycena epipterygia]